MSTVGSIRPVGRITCSMKMPWCAPSPSRRRRADIGRLRPERVPFLELQRPVVDRRGRRKPNSASTLLRLKSPRNMPPICGTVTWLSSQISSEFLGKYSNRVGAVARLAARQIARVVLDAGAGARSLQHLDVEQRSLLQPLRLEQPAGPVELLQALLQIGLYSGRSPSASSASASHSGCWHRR